MCNNVNTLHRDSYLYTLYYVKYRKGKYLTIYTLVKYKNNSSYSCFIMLHYITFAPLSTVQTAMSIIKRDFERRLVESYYQLKSDMRYELRTIQKPKPISIDPSDAYRYAQLKAIEEEKLPKSDIINSIIDEFCLWLFKNKYEFKHYPRKMCVSLSKPKKGIGYKSVYYKSNGYVEVSIGGYSIDFQPKDLDDLLKKLKLYKVVDYPS